ncbi:TPA: lysine decarboxylation/transport transcriptional activator CadC [Escherichia coli]|nr:CadC family transcriptional regulator [Escherichia coli]EFD4958902.1 CadC family transcriptional regulator [Escherichia coli]HCO0151426.1 lysine decarboxylation/transport transcriptional activator CadC [Escherichia coli]HCO0323204.1 lysine decarboxylation/transport transcriptional activator CadC [Escherichia coli]
MQQPVVRVGEWLVTPSINQISRNGRQLTLEPRLIDLLVFFAQHSGEVLSRDELIDNVWKRSIVTNHVVTQSISELRKSLKDNDEDSPVYIATVPKRGYKLMVPVIWYSEEEGKEIMLSSPPPIPEAVPATDSPSHSLNIQNTATPPEQSPVKSKRFTTFWVWFFFLLSLGICVALVAFSSLDTRLPMSKSRILLNPRDIDINMVNKSCNSWSSPYQLSYAIGVGDLVATSLNTFSTFMVHDKINYNIDEPSSSGKTLSIAFVNQRQYRAQQCFMSIKLVDNADGSTMLDKRYVITNGNQLAIQNDLLESLSKALNQPWPQRMQETLQQILPHRGALLTNFYQAHDYLLHGDDKSLNRASELLGEIVQSSPEFTYARAEKALVDIVRHSQHPLDEKQLAALNTEIDNIVTLPELNNLSIIYQIKAVSALVKGKTDESYQAINTGIDLEMSWLNYVLLGKVYEMKGMNREAADAYLTAFNLRPGANTLYWIENGIFQTSVPYVVPYLDKFLASE